jgi:putative phosphoribosyl transferase
MEQHVDRFHPVCIPSTDAVLHGDLFVPSGALGLVLFAHGSGSSRFSPRNRRVAESLRDARLGTLLFDLLTPDEERLDAIDARLRFDIDLLAHRLTGATEWVSIQPPAADLPIGYFGASTGAAAALIAAARLPRKVAAVVSRGGRPDLAGPYLPEVQAPTLFIVGGADREVLELNRAAAMAMRARHRIAVVAGATHLFEEPGALDQVARLAREFLVAELGAACEAAGTADVHLRPLV